MSHLTAEQWAAVLAKRADDAQWLADRLFAEAEQGDTRARRLLCHGARTLRQWGARVPEPTWPPVWERAADLL